MPKYGTSQFPRRKVEGLRPILDLTGRIFGQLKVIELVSLRPPIWRCLCACGNEAHLKTFKIIDGTKSCGCLYAAKGRKPKENDVVVEGRPNHFAANDNLYTHIRNMILVNGPSNIEE